MFTVADPGRSMVLPLNQLEGLWEHCKLPQQGPRLSQKPLVAIILSILKCMFYSSTVKI